MLTQEVNSFARSFVKMDIVFENNKLQKECNDQRLLEKNHGKDRAKRIRRRLDDLRAADVLEDMRNLPGRCHE